MASTNILAAWAMQSAELAVSAFPQFVVRNNHLGLAFDVSVREECYFTGVMPQHYAAGGITTLVHWTQASNTSTNIVGWKIAFERIGAAQQDIDADGFAADVTAVLLSANATPGNVVVQPISAANGAAIDSIAVGEMFRLKLTRDVSGDVIHDDVQVLLVEMKES